MDESWYGLWVFIAICVAAAASGALFPPGRWYASLTKPAWCPPNWLFAPAWSLLYAMIAVAGFLVWRAAGGLAEAPLAMSLYGLQLALNAGWSGIFFGMRRMDLALAELTLLWLAIAATILAFWPIHAGAALMMVPYLAWVSFAGVLNLSLLRLNGRRVTANA